MIEMKKRGNGGGVLPWAVGMALLVPWACGRTSAVPSQGHSGSGGSATAGGSSGGASTGGASTGGASTGGTSGVGGSTGGASSGGTSTGGAAPGAAGSASTSTGGASHDVTGSGGAASAGASGHSATGGAGSPVDAGVIAADAGVGPAGIGPAFVGPTVPGTVDVNRAQTAGQIGPGFAGFSFEKTHMTNGTFTGRNAALIALFNLLGPTVIRIGADDVDKCTWDPAAKPGPGGPPYARTIGTAMVDDLADFCQATGARIIYGVNFDTATPENSAAEATYVTSKLGAHLYGFEIGNEINRFGSWATTLKPKWESFASAILAANPGAHLVGPAGGGGDQTSLSTPFAMDESGKNLILLTQHYYAGTANTATATLAKLLTPDPFPITSGQGLIEMLEVMSTAATANHIPDGFRIGECNTFSGHGQVGLSNALISALWSLDFFFTSARYGASGINFHGGEAGMDGSTPFVYSPVQENAGVVTGAAPIFYGMLLFSLAGSGTALATTISAGAIDFTAYALQRSDGSTSVVLDNKDVATGVRVTVNLGVAVKSANALYLEGPSPVSLMATSGVTLGGVGISAQGAWTPNPPYALAAAGTTVTVLVPPGTAALVRAQ